MAKSTFYYGYPYKQLNKHYSYHGLNLKCSKPPDPEPFHDFPAPLDAYAVKTLDAINISNNSATLVGLLWVAAGAEPAIMVGFEYKPEGEDYYLIVYEMGSFMSTQFELEMNY
jgi:hypothetical protein